MRVVATNRDGKEVKFNAKADADGDWRLSRGQIRKLGITRSTYFDFEPSLNGWSFKDVNGDSLEADISYSYATYFWDEDGGQRWYWKPDGAIVWKREDEDEDDQDCGRDWYYDSLSEQW